MFDKPGEKLKALAIIDFIIMLIASVVLAFIYGKSGYRNEFNIGLFLLIAVVGSLVGYIFSLVLYAFGELIDSSERNAYNSTELLQLLSKRESNNGSEAYSTASKTTLPNSFKMSACVDEPEPDWICPACKTRNKPSTNVCKYCRRDRLQ